MEKTNKVLITGGAGFVCSNIVNELIKLNYEVCVLDNLFTGFEKFLPKHKNLKFILGDVCDKDLIDNLIQEYKYIIHGAAKNIIASTKNPYEDFETNVGGTLNILMSSKKWGIKKLVYIGSASVYGNPKILPVSEDSATYTLSPYATSKLAGENYCTAFYESYGLPISIVRYSNVYGINQDPSNPYCGVVSKFFDFAMNNNDIIIHGDGEQTRDFTYVLDSVNATIECLINQKSIGNIYNVGCGFETSINVLAEKIIKITNSNSKIIKVDKRDIDNIRRRSVNIESIRRSLKWQPKFTLDNGLDLTYNWIKNKINYD
jgi:UDP-glucose 4-epimerase